MNAHLDAKAAREWERSEPDHELVRRAERMADPTDPMHDARREAQAERIPIRASPTKSDARTARPAKGSAAARRSRTRSSRSASRPGGRADTDPARLEGPEFRDMVAYAVQDLERRPAGARSRCRPICGRK